MPPATRRRPRATRPMILDAARTIARREGWHAVTIRRIAGLLGYTSPLIYEHFRDKEDALAEVVREGFRDLREALTASLAAHDGAPPAPTDPAERVQAMAAAYLAFARARPEVYQIMHAMGGVALDPAETARGAAAVCDVAADALRAWAVAEGLPLADALSATDVLWSALHGTCCLVLVGRLAGGAPRADALVRRTVADLLAGWRSASA